MNIALFFTISRLVVLPGIIYFLFFNTKIDNNLISFSIVIILYIYGALSDYWDGKFARKYNLVSRLGEFLDPLADKLFVLGVFICFVNIDLFYLPAWLIIIIAVREVAITTIRIIALTQNKIMKTEKHGKIKTVSQITTQGICLAVLLVYNIIFVTQGYRLFLNSWTEGAHYSIRTFRFFLVQAGPLLSRIMPILYYLPLVFAVIATLITIFSGVSYIIVNRAIIFPKSSK